MVVFKLNLLYYITLHLFIVFINEILSEVIHFLFKILSEAMNVPIDFIKM